MTIQFLRAQEADLARAVPRQVLLEQNPGFCQEFRDFLVNRMESEGGNLFFRQASSQPGHITGGDFERICVITQPNVFAGFRAS